MRKHLNSFIIIALSPKSATRKPEWADRLARWVLSGRSCQPIAVHGIGRTDRERHTSSSTCSSVNSSHSVQATSTPSRHAS